MPITLAYILAEIRTNDESNTLDKIDVAVIRDGIAGIAASIHLARAGMSVVSSKRAWLATETGFWLGQTYLLLGRPKEALPYFEASLDKHFILLVTMQDCGWAKNLSNDPRLCSALRSDS